MAKLGFIGGGNMAEALIKGVISAGVFGKSDISVSDISKERLEYLKKEYLIGVFSDNSQLAGESDILILSVKPQNINDVLGEIKGSIKNGAVIVSIAAGIKTEKITSILGDVPVIRVMPNTPALVGAGMSGLFANKQAGDFVGQVKNILDAVGESVIIENEDMMDAVTAISGSGPAYFFLLIEELIKAGKTAGLDEETASVLAIQTAKGAAILAEKASEKSETPGNLRKKVTSPGGTTEAALREFAKGQFSQLVSKAVMSAVARGRELSV
jgi:pyrroline-5-carboxylate reductase